MGHVRFYCTCIHGVGLYIIDDYVNMVHKKIYIYIYACISTLYSVPGRFIFSYRCVQMQLQTQSVSFWVHPPLRQVFIRLAATLSM